MNFSLPELPPDARLAAALQLCLVADLPLAVRLATPESAPDCQSYEIDARMFGHSIAKSRTLAHNVAGQAITVASDLDSGRTLCQLVSETGAPLVFVEWAIGIGLPEALLCRCGISVDARAMSARLHTTLEEAAWRLQHIKAEDLDAWRAAAQQAHRNMSAETAQCIVSIVRATRPGTEEFAEAQGADAESLAQKIIIGPSARATHHLCKLLCALTALNGDLRSSPSDLQQLATLVLSHQITVHRADNEQAVRETTVANALAFALSKAALANHERTSA